MYVCILHKHLITVVKCIYIERGTTYHECNCSSLGEYLFDVRLNLVRNRQTVDVVLPADETGHGGTTAVLQTVERAQRQRQRHFRLGGRRTDDREQIFVDARESGEGDPERTSVLEVGEGPTTGIKQQSDCRRLVLPERLRVRPGCPVVPQQTLVR